LDINEDAEKRGGTGLSAPTAPNEIFAGLDRFVNAKTGFRLQAFASIPLSTMQVWGLAVDAGLRAASIDYSCLAPSEGF